MRPVLFFAVVAAVVAAGAIAWRLNGTRAVDEDATDVLGAEGDGGGPTPSLLAPRTKADGRARTAEDSDVFGVVRRDGQPVAARVEAHAVAVVASGAPIPWSHPGADLRCLDPVDARPPAAVASAGADGAYRLVGLVRGTYRVTATTDDRAYGSESVDLPGDAAVERDLVVTAGAYALKGHARNPDGTPWRGVVRAVRQRTTIPLPRGFTEDPTPPDAPSASVGDDGAFVVRGLDAGRYLVRAEMPGWLRATGPETWVPREADYDLVVGEGLHPLEGRVLDDESGSPIVGATVLCGVEQTWTRSVTDTAGRFHVLAGPSTYYSARAPGWSLGANYVAEGVTDFTIMLTRAGRIVGRVTREGDGEPVAGVALLAVRRSGGSAGILGQTATSGADGRFEIEDVAASLNLLTVRGENRVLVRAGGSPGPIAQVLVGRGATVSVEVVVGDGGTARGRVVDREGHPVASARVEATSKPSDDAEAGFSPPVGTALTDADGRFAVAGLVSATAHDLRATAPGFVAGTLALEAGRADATGLEIRLARAASLDVQVLAETGEPLPVADVAVWLPDSGVASDAAPGPDGWAHLFGVCEGARLYVRAPGRLTHTGTLGAPDASGRCPPFVVRLAASFSIRGRVVYADAMPAAGAQVRLDDGGSTSTTADADGRFSFDDVAAGDHTLSARAPGADGPWFAAREPGETASSDATSATWSTVRAGERDARLVLRVNSPPPAEPEPKPIRVRVLDPHGDPVPQATVRYVTPDAQAKVSAIAGWAEVPRSTTALVATVGSSSSGSRLSLGPSSRVAVGPGADLVELRMVRGLRVAGVVVDESGRGVAGATVTAKHAAGAQEWGAYLSADWRQTDDRGRFEMASLSDVAHEVSVDPPIGFQPPTTISATPGGAELRIVLERSRQAVVTVVDPRGRPVEGATLAVRGGAGPVAPRQGEPSTLWNAITDRTGRAALDRLEAGKTYVVDVQPPGSRADLSPRRLDRFEPADATVTLDALLLVRGVVRDTDGKPVTGASVSLRDLAGKPTRSVSGQWISSVESGGDGQFEFRGMAAGSYRVRARFAAGHLGLPQEFYLDPQELEADAGADAIAQAGADDVVLRVDPGLSLKVRLEGYRGGPGTGRRPRAELFALDASDARGGWVLRWGGVTPTATAEVDDEGRAEFTHLPRNGRYALFVTPTVDGLCARRAEVRPGSDPLLLRLEKGSQIRGTLRGAAVGGFTVTAECEGILLTGRKTGDATFEFDPLPPGRYRVTVVGAADQQILRGTADATAGSDVTIDLSPVDEAELLPDK